MCFIWRIFLPLFDLELTQQLHSLYFAKNEYNDGAYWPIVLWCMRYMYIATPLYIDRCIHICFIHLQIVACLCFILTQITASHNSYRDYIDDDHLTYTEIFGSVFFIIAVKNWRSNVLLNSLLNSFNSYFFTLYIKYCTT